MSFFQEKKFNNVRPDGSATAVTLVATQVNSTRIVKNIFVSNSGAATQYGIYHSASSTVSAALYHNVDISASTTAKISTYIPVESSGSPVVVIAKNPTLTFTAYGAEVIETPFNN